MKITEHSLIYNEWIESEIERYKKLRESTDDEYTKDLCYTCIMAYAFLKLQLINPMPYFDKVFEDGGDVANKYENSTTMETWQEVKDNYLNSDISI